MSKKELVFRRVLSGSLSAYFGHRGEIKKQKDTRRKNIANSVILTKEQKQQINTFFKQHLGHKIGYQWHKLYTAISGSFDYRFFPEFFYSSDIQRLLNHPGYYIGLADKNILPFILKGSHNEIKVPKTLCSCSNGIYLDINSEATTLDKCVDLISKTKSFFIKPSIDSNSGIGCEIILVDKMNKDELKNVLTSHGKNFVVQEPIIAQNDISSLNPSSVNTFRVITYIIDGIVYTTPIIMRVGRDNSCCDNAHAGGLFVAVSNDGEIVSDGKTEFGGSFKCHPNTGITFKGYRLKNVEKVICSAKKAALLMPHVGVIDWDFTIDVNGDPVLIEGNLFGGGVWLVQMAHGVGAFGDQTARILEIIRNNKTLY